MKNIIDLIEEQFYSVWYKRNVFAFGSERDNLAMTDKSRRNKTLQFQIIKSSQNKIRKNGK
jgi:hypothetical protein